MNYDYLERVDRHVLMHPQLSQALKTIEKAIISSASSKNPVNVLLTGDAGTGKTTTCQKILSKYPRKQVSTELGENTIIPAFYSLIPAPATIRSVGEGMLQKLLTTGGLGGTTSEITVQLGQQLKHRQTKVIMLDELQHLLNGDRRTHDVRNWIKHINNEYKVPLVVVGMPECAQVINDDDQLARRFPYQVKLTNFEAPSPENTLFVEYLMSLLSVFEAEAKVSINLNPTKYLDAFSVYLATGGNPSQMTALLKEAVSNAKMEERKNVEKKDFENAVYSLTLHARKTRSNPFSQGDETLKALINQLTQA